MDDVLYSPFQERIIENVSAHGWHILTVLGDEVEPGWGYTIGLVSSFAHPEVLIFGLSEEESRVILDKVGEHVRGGGNLADGSTDDAILGGKRAVFRSVAREWYAATAGFAVWFHHELHFPLLQLFWPDRRGWYPWDVDCDPAVKVMQPRLFLTDPAAAQARWLAS